MKRFKSILVHVNDETKQTDALARAGELARENGAAITVVDVVPGEPVTHPRLMPPPWVLPSERAERKRAFLREVVRPLQEAGREVAVKILFGKDYVEIIREVLGRGHDLVMKTAEPDGVLTFGSMATRLLRKCPCPVWIVKPGCTGSCRRVVAAVDVGSADPDQLAMNFEILSLAADVAAHDSAELHVLHVWSAPGEDVMKGYYQRPPEETERYARDLRAFAGENLQELLARQGLSLPGERIHVLKGTPSPTIVEFVREHDVDQLVMGALARRGVSGMLIGNTAEKVLGQIGCSVIAVKPPDFETPIKLAACRGRDDHR